MGQTTAMLPHVAPPLPPKGRGLPWMGEAFSILRDPSTFLSARHERFGNVFRASLWGQEVVFLSGSAARQMCADPENITRLGSRALPLHQLFSDVHFASGRVGSRHWGLRELLFKAATPHALASYAPRVSALARHFTREAFDAGNAPWVPRLKRFGLEAASAALLGWQEEEVATLREDYELLAAASVALPLPWPGTLFLRGLSARKRILTRLREAVRSQRECAGDTGLRRILSAQRGDGLRINDAEAALELHHVLLACHGLFAPVAHALRLLDTDPQRRAAIHAECKNLSQADLAGPATLASLRTLNTALQEAQDAPTLLPLVGGTAVRTFEVQGWRIPAGWDVYLDSGDQMPVPAPGARSLGLTLKHFLATQLLATALREFAVHLGSQDLSYTFDRLPPEPRDGLRVTLVPLDWGITSSP